MWELDCEESWAPTNWCFWTVVLEKTLESPLDCKEIQPVHSRGDQPWDFFGRNDAKAETPVLWPPHVNSWLIGKDSDVGKDWGQEEKGTTEDDGWMTSLTQWMWVWVNSGSWWWTGRPGVLQFMGSQRVWHDWATKLNWTELNWDNSDEKVILAKSTFILFLFFWICLFFLFPKFVVEYLNMKTSYTALDPNSAKIFSSYLICFSFFRLYFKNIYSPVVCPRLCS